MTLHHSLVYRPRSLLRKDKGHFIRTLAEVEGHFLVYGLRPSYQTLRKLKSTPFSKVTADHLVDGQLVLECVGVRNAVYFGQLTVSLDASGVIIPVLDPPISEVPLSLTEISKLQSGKATGIRSIPAQLLKAGGEPGSRVCMSWLSTGCLVPFT